MHRVCRMLLATFVILPVHAQDLLPARASYRAMTAPASPYAPAEWSTLTLQRTDERVYALALAVVAPTASHHTGRIEGDAILDGEVITLDKTGGPADLPPENPSMQCSLRIRVTKDVATVLSEDGCAAWLGAGASFVEQGQALLRTP